MGPNVPIRHKVNLKLGDMAFIQPYGHVFGMNYACTLYIYTHACEGLRGLPSPPIHLRENVALG